MSSLYRLALSAPFVLLLSCHAFSLQQHTQTVLEPTLLRDHCAHVSPISRTEFEVRQSNLANVLERLGGSAYITEPSANSQYFGNFSVTDWKLSERPLLFVVQPTKLQTDGSILPKLTVVAPKFEHRRASLLPIPFHESTGLRSVDWAEDEDPYEAALKGLGLVNSSRATIYVDSGVRKFIADGLHKAAPHALIESAPLEITRLRERKSPHELEIMRCANQANVLAIRNVHERVKLGMRESEVGAMLRDALADAGLKNGGCLTLFGPNAALPHGSGTDRSLTSSDFALFDCGGSLHGYMSDVTRTVAFSASKIPERQLQLWNIVQNVQAEAFQSARAGKLTKLPDETARNMLRSLNLEQYFTHRLGHGIGLEGHERPYLRGNSEDVIQTGNAFSNEPGLYIEGELGIRLEDCFYINSDGDPVYLTDGPQTSPWTP